LHLLSGGLMIGAFFMATDYVTSPLSRNGKILFGIGCGLLTALLRIFGSMSGGVSFAIIFMNILTPHLDRWTIPVPFGGVRRAKS
jgi:electron transport complex protein RnfD